MMRHHSSRGRPIQNSEFRIQNGVPIAPTCNLQLATCNLQPATWNLQPAACHWRLRRSFTLTELLIVMMILSIMAGLALSAVSGAMELAREQRTRAIIAKLDQLIMERYEEYRTRAVPIRIAAGTPPQVAAEIRLNALRDLMRMEMPDRKSDLVDPPCDCDPRTGINPLTNQPFILQLTSPSLRTTYLRQVNRTVGNLSNWSIVSQGAECLYLIVSTMQDGDKAALDFFSPNEIGDYDGDGMKEILDAWGRPIEFIRWPAGYVIEQKGKDNGWGIQGTDDDGANGTDDFGEWLWTGSDDYRLTITTQTVDLRLAPDPFNPLRVGVIGHATRPLIMSAGRDKEFDMVSDHTTGGFSYCPTPVNNNAANPYSLVNVTVAGTNLSLAIGTPFDLNDDGSAGFADNITNHYQETP